MLHLDNSIFVSTHPGNAGTQKARYCMVFVHLEDDIAALSKLRHAAPYLRKQNIHTVEDLLNAPGDILSPYLQRFTQDLLVGSGDYGIPELGLILPDAAGEVFWSLDHRGCLTICGEGRVPDYTCSRRPPWEPLRDQIRSISVEEKITRLGALSFRDCPKLSRVTCSPALRRIGTGAFRDCTALETVQSPLPLLPLRDLEVSDLPTQALRFGHYAFAGTPWARTHLGEFFLSGTRLLEYHGSDTHLRIPDGITEICPMVFENMPVETVEFPESLVCIRDFAFRGTCLETLELPPKLARIGNRAFGDCPKLGMVNIRNRWMDAHPDTFADTPLAHCGRKVNGRWSSRYAINCRPEEGMAPFLAMDAGLSDTSPLGLKSFYPRTEFLKLLRQGKCLIRVNLDPQNHLVERVWAYSLDRTCGIVWKEGWRDEYYPATLPDGVMDLSSHYRVYRTSDQLRKADIRGLTLARKQYPVRWYCIDNPRGDIPGLVSAFLPLWLAANPDYRLPPSD